MLRDGLGPRDGRLIAFSTAGDDEESALGRMRASAHDMGLETTPETRSTGMCDAGGSRFTNGRLDNVEEADDLDLALLANPASWLDRARA